MLSESLIRLNFAVTRVDLFATIEFVLAAI